MATNEHTVKVELDTTDIDESIAKFKATYLEIRLAALDRAIHVAEFRNVPSIVEYAEAFEKYLRGEKDD